MLNPLAFVSNIISGNTSKVASNNSPAVSDNDNGGFKNALNQVISNNNNSNQNKQNNGVDNPAKQNTLEQSNQAQKQEAPQKASAEGSENSIEKQEVKEEPTKAISPEVFELSKQLELADNSTPKLEPTLTEESVETSEKEVKTETAGSDPDVEIEIKVPDFVPQPITIEDAVQENLQVSTEAPVNGSAINEVEVDGNINTEKAALEAPETEAVENTVKSTVKGSEFQQPAWLNAENTSSDKVNPAAQHAYEQKVQQRKPLSLNSNQGTSAEVLTENVSKLPEQANQGAVNQNAVDALSAVDGKLADKTVQGNTSELETLQGLDKVAQKELPEQANQQTSEAAQENSRLTREVSHQDKPKAVTELSQHSTEKLQANTNASEKAIVATGKNIDAENKQDLPKLTVPATGEKIEALSTGEVKPKVEADTEVKGLEFAAEIKTDKPQADSKSAVKNAGTVNIQNVLNNPNVDSVQVQLESNTTVAEENVETGTGEFAQVLDTVSETSSTNTAAKPQVSNLNTGLQFNAQAPQASTQTNTTVAAPQAEQVSGAMLEQLQSGKNEVTLNLSPDELGPVRIRVTQTGAQQVSTRMIVATQEARDLLEGQLNQLKTKMDSHGVSLEKVTIVVAGQAETSSEFGQQKGGFGENAQGQQQQQSTGNNQQQTGQENLWTQFDQNNQNNTGQQQANNNGSSNTQSSDVLTGDTETATPTTHLGNYNENGQVSVLA